MDQSSQRNVSLKSPVSLKRMAFDVETRAGNKLLHRIVIENSQPDANVNKLYISAVLRSLSWDLPVNCLNKHGYSALHLAVKRGNHCMVEIILSCINHLDINALTAFSWWNRGETALNLAVQLQHYDIIKTLLLNKADINKAGSLGNRAIHYAVEQRNLEIVRLLCDNGCDLNVKNDSDYTPIYKCNSFVMCELLISRGANLNVKNVLGETPLHNAAQENNSEILRSFLENGAEVNATDRHNGTALNIAVNNRNCEFVKILISSGANVNFKDLRRNTALHLASKQLNSDIVDVLLKNGANVNASNAYRETALHKTLNDFRANKLSERLEVIKLLLSYGADIDACDYKGQSSLSLAQKLHQAVIVEVLTRKKNRKQR